MSSPLSPPSISPSAASSKPESQPKNFEVAFGNLSSLYGIHGIPSSTSTPASQEVSTPSWTTSSKCAFVSRLSWSILRSKELPPKPPSDSSESPFPLVPLGRHNSASSDTTIVQPPVVQKTKRDYEAAFGALSSTYGIGGHIPAPPTKQVKSVHTWSKLRGLFSTRKTSTKPSQDGRSIVTQPSADHKVKYQAAFGDLVSAYGTGGNISSLFSKRVRTTHGDCEAKKSLRLARVSSARSAAKGTSEGKNHNAALGALASSYGLYGCTPVPSMANNDFKY